ncbi:MAG: AraC family transcriptional regulator [Lentisphaeria bacterium]|nr:AraC family transcriptional regulator [Lentisphaeria bacterium]
MYKTPCEALQAGRFISRGKSRHGIRTINTWELILVISGTLDMFAGDREYHLVPGDRLLLNAGVRHGGLSDYVPELSFYWVHFVPRTSAADEELRNLPRQLAVGSRARAAEYCQLYLARQADDPENKEARDLILHLILQETSRGIFSSESVPEPSSDNMMQPARLAFAARRKIQVKFYSPQLNTSALAAELCCNPDYLGRIYHNTFGVTITHDIHSMRLDLVHKLLVGSALSIKEIAQRAGFEDSGYFRKVFFRRFAMTPREYRLTHMQGYANSE